MFYATTSCNMYHESYCLDAVISGPSSAMRCKFVVESSVKAAQVWKSCRYLDPSLKPYPRYTTHAEISQPRLGRLSRFRGRGYGKDGIVYRGCKTIVENFK